MLKEPIMKLYIYQWIAFFNILLLSSIACAQPNLSQAQAEKLIKQEMQYERLYWTPFPLPYEVPQTSTNKDAKLLSALARHGLVSKESVKVEVGLHNNKPQYELRWHYHYQPLRQPYDEEGFYYGRPKLLRITKLSEPQTAKSRVFVMAEIEWVVIDMQAWIKDPAFEAARTLRRSQHSASQPFEKKIYFEYLPDSDEWQHWLPES